MDIDAESVLQQIKPFKDEILETETRVKQYLSDRDKYPHPQFEDLIHQVRRFENSIYKINFGFSNTEIQLRLDGLLHSVLVYEQSWKRMFERDSEEYEAELTHRSAPPVEPRANPLLDKVYSYAQKKWSESGVKGRESKEDLAKRLLPAYKAAKKKLKPGQKIAVAYDAESKQVKLSIKSGGGT
jgi:hypothetical protein